MESKELDEVRDEELAAQAKAGDIEAEEVLLKRYGEVVKREVRFLFLVGAETEDLTQEAMIGLVKAIRDYTPEREAAFRTYAITCIRNQIRSAIRAAGRKKHQPLNSYISIYTDAEEQGEGLPAGLFATGDAGNPETIVLMQERADEQRQAIEERLSPMERLVAELYLEGRSHAEIAAAIGKPERSVNNALTRIRNKLRD